MKQDDQEMFMLLIMAVGLLYSHQKGLLKPYIEKLKTLISGATSNLGGGTGAGAGAGGFSEGTTCPGGTSCKFDGTDRWECDDIKGDSYEATWCGSVPNPSDTLSIKMWGGPKHNAGGCCWCILEVDEN
jgi:hypothetical protein